MTMAGAPETAAVAPTRERRWLPLVIVTILIVVVAGGARSVADATATDAGPISMGPVRVEPPEGWRVEGSVGPTSVVLHKGPVMLDISVAQPAAGGPVVVASVYRELRLEPAFEHLLPGAPEAATLPSGIPAASFSYLAGTADGVILNGLVVAADAPDASVVFDVRAPSAPELANVLEDVRSMVEGATI
jgi:hypothetical protein